MGIKEVCKEVDKLFEELGVNTDFESFTAEEIADLEKQFKKLKYEK